MRICLYTNTAFPDLGGQEMVVDELARQYQSAGHTALVLCPDRPHAHAFDRQLPYPVVRHPRFVSTRWLLSWYAWGLRRLQQRHQFDVIHCHNVYPSAYLALKVQEFGRPVVAVTSHGGDVRDDNPRFTKPGLRQRHEWVARQADALISIGPFTTEGFLRLGADPARLHHITNGVHVRGLAERVTRPATLPHNLQADGYYLALGRLAHRKGVDIILKAMANSAIQLAIGGDGPERAALETLANELGIAHRVTFLGKVQGDSKRWLLQNARTIIMATREWEALPMVLLEAHAAACPVMASDAAGLRGLVEEGTTGWVTPREDHQALARAIARVEQLSLAERQAIGENGQRKAWQFDWPLIAQQHLQLFRTLLASQQKQAA
jgi:glycosyltransferase involved in cell wall biosynthesis